MSFKRNFFDLSLHYHFWGRCNPRWLNALAVFFIAMALALIIRCVTDIYISKKYVFELAKQKEYLNIAAIPQVKITQYQALSQEHRAAVNAVVDQLNISWHQVFEQLEDATPDNIALLSIEPDGKNSVIKFQAEAKSLDSLLLYASSLENRGLFGQLNYSKHETFEQDPNKPIRLSFELGLLASDTSLIRSSESTLSSSNLLKSSAGELH
jgi:hypothetical protein